MSQGVEFDEDKWGAAAYRRPQAGGSSGGYGFNGSSNQPKGIVGWLLKHHLAKTEKGAQIIMLVIVAINICITIWAMSSAL